MRHRLLETLLGLTVALLVGCGPTLLWYGRSPDRGRRALLVAEGAHQRLVVDDVAHAAWDAVAITHLRWSREGPVYPARRGDRWHVVIAGRAGPAFDAIGELAIDGARVAYCALDAEGWHVVAGGEVGPAFRAIRAGSLRWIAHTALYVGRDAHGERVVQGAVDALGPPFEAVSRIEVGAKGALVGYVGAKEGRAQLVIAGVPGPIVDEVAELVIASDEARWAAVIREGAAYALLRDELDSGATPLDHAPRALAISADGARVAWAMDMDDGLAIELDGSPIARGLDRARHMSFVPRAGALTFAGQHADEWRVYHDGTPGPSFEAIEALIVSDAGQWAYVGRHADGDREVFVDGVSRFRGAWAGALELARARPRWAFLAREGGRSFVVAPDGRVEVSHPFADSLVVDDEGCWALTIARPEARRVDIVADGGVIGALDVQEVGAAFLQRRAPPAAVRDIVRGELARARREGRACHPETPRVQSAGGGS